MKTRSVVLLALAVAFTAVMASPAHADNVAPRIDSFVRQQSGDPTPGGRIDVDIKTTDEGGSGIGYVFLQYRSDHGQLIQSSGGMRDDGVFVASGIVNKWGESGVWHLDLLYVSDRQGNETTYHRDGSVTVKPEGATPPGNTLDLSAGNFTLDNPNEDLSPPSLASASLFMRTVVAGTPALLLYDARDEGSGIAGVMASWSSPQAQGEWAQDFGPLASVGPVAWLVPIEATGGTYTFESITLIDGAGNRTTYGADGKATTDPAALPAPGATPDGIGSLNIDVTPLLEDTSAPSLDSISLRHATVRDGEQIALDYAASDGGSGVGYTAIRYVDDHGHAALVEKLCGKTGTGPATFTVPSYFEPGVWRADSITVVDRMRHYVYYMRDGGVIASPNSGAPSRHSFDLSSLDFTVQAGSPRYKPAPATSDDFSCINAVTELTLGAGLPGAEIGEKIPLVGTVRRNGRGVRRPLTAFYAYQGAKPALLGIVQGSDGGAISKIVAAARGQYRARFFGLDGPEPSPPAMSAPMSIRLGTHATLIAAIPSTASYGGPLTIRLRLVDTHSAKPLAGRSVSLQQRAAGTGSYATVAWATVGKDGWVTFSRRLTRKTDLRGVFAGAGAYLPASVTRTVAVR